MVFGKLFDKRYTDNMPKKILLFVSTAVAVMSLLILRKAGASFLTLLVALLLNMLLIWASLYAVTCLRDGKCNFYAHAVTIFSIIICCLQLFATNVVFYF